jgi:hypothetical protein
MNLGAGVNGLLGQRVQEVNDVDGSGCDQATRDALRERCRGLKFKSGKFVGRDMLAVAMEHHGYIIWCYECTPRRMGIPPELYEYAKRRKKKAETAPTTPPVHPGCRSVAMPLGTQADAMREALRRLDLSNRNGQAEFKRLLQGEWGIIPGAVRPPSTVTFGGRTFPVGDVSMEIPSFPALHDWSINAGPVERVLEVRVDGKVVPDHVLAAARAFGIQLQPGDTIHVTGTPEGGSYTYAYTELEPEESSFLDEGKAKADDEGSFLDGIF